MCTLVSLKELIMPFFLYPLELLRSGSLCRAVGGERAAGGSRQISVERGWGTRPRWMTALVFLSISLFFLFLVLPAVKFWLSYDTVTLCILPHIYWDRSAFDSPKFTQFILLRFKFALWASWNLWGQHQSWARKWGRSLHSACEHVRSRAAPELVETAAHSLVFTAAPFEDTPVVSCLILHFVLPPRTQRNVSVNSGDTQALYK